MNYLELPLKFFHEWDDERVISENMLKVSDDILQLKSLMKNTLEAQDETTILRCMFYC